jgi:Heterokaryon incompatibility protein (HET)
MDLQYMHKDISKREFRCFRLLRLDPGHRSDLLRGELEERNIDADNSYEAISYVWGSNEKPHTLMTSQGFISITVSLDRALRRIRLTTTARWLWVDAVCINQSDVEMNEEKPMQIAMMSEIYRKASRTIIYLSEDVELPRRLRLSIGGFEINSKDLDVTTAALTQSWFTRAWVTQEYIMSGKCLWIMGNYEWNKNELELMARVRESSDIAAYSGTRFANLPTPLDTSVVGL